MSETGGSERRRSPRYSEHRWSCCYLDGTRFDAESPNISATGTFLETERDVPMEAPVVVVYDRPDCVDSFQVFLVGKVVRLQRSQPIGVGVAWIRAVTEGPAAELGDFLLHTLRLPTDAPKPELRRVAKKLFAEFRHVPEYTESPAPPAEAEPSPQDAKRDVVGPITQMVWDPETVLDVQLLVRVNIGGTWCEVQLIKLGRGSLTLRAAVAPIDPDAPVRVDIPIPRSSGELIHLGLKARLERVGREPRTTMGQLQFSILDVEDAGIPGGFDRYLKALAVRMFIRGAASAG